MRLNTNIPEKLTQDQNVTDGIESTSVDNYRPPQGTADANATRWLITHFDKKWDKNCLEIVLQSGKRIVVFKVFGSLAEYYTRGVNLLSPSLATTSTQRARCRQSSETLLATTGAVVTTSSSDEPTPSKRNPVRIPCSVVCGHNTQLACE